MKRLVISAVAASMLAASALSGQAAPLSQPAAPQSATVHVDWRKPDHRHTEKRVIIKKQVVKRNHWKRGEKYRDWRKHERINDWQRRHLRRPGPGQQCVRVGNDYLLVSVLSGVIAGIVAAH